MLAPGHHGNPGCRELVVTPVRILTIQILLIAVALLLALAIPSPAHATMAWEECNQRLAAVDETISELEAAMNVAAETPGPDSIRRICHLAHQAIGAIDEHRTLLNEQCPDHLPADERSKQLDENSERRNKFMSALGDCIAESA